MAQQHELLLINDFRILEKHCGKAIPLVSDVGILYVNDMPFPCTITITRVNMLKGPLILIIPLIVSNRA